MHQTILLLGENWWPGYISHVGFIARDIGAKSVSVANTGR